MYSYNDILDVHFEVTSKCQARCPMCIRRINGGMLNPFIELNEVSLDTFKKWFPHQFIKQLNSFFMCGNYGDPIIARDSLQILQYIREQNPSIQLSMHTNGSARSKEWWKHLASTDTRVVFGIDGLADTHSLYRIDTDFDKIIENAQEFINSGGHAEWNMLVFKHNEHQVEDCRILSRQLGFKNFQVKHTTRFQGDSFPVLDDSGKVTHYLEASDRSVEILQKVKFVKSRGDISCKASKWKQIYVSTSGNVTPCCWTDVKDRPHNNPSRYDYMNKVGIFPNLEEYTLENIFDSGYFEMISDTWFNDPLHECSRQCGTFDKFGEQFI